MSLGVGTLGINPDAFGVWRPDDPGNIRWDGFLDATAAAGFRAVELGPYGYLPTDPSMLADELEARSLELTCGYLSTRWHDETSHETARGQLAELAGTIGGAGAEFVLLLAATGHGPTGRLALDDHEWPKMVTGLLDIQAVAAEEYGLRSVFHPHVGMAVETTAETTRLIDDTAGSLSLCLDTGQFAYPGGDPAAFMRDHGAVISYLHLRDLDASIRDQCVADNSDFATAADRGVFCEPQSGSIDFRAVVDAARAVDFDGPVIVERSLLGCTDDEAREAARQAFAAYNALGFGGES